jgi:hypothetical protein
LLAAFAAPRPAQAIPLEDPATGLRLETDAAKAQVCRVIPPPDRDGLAACEGVDVAAVAAKMRGSGREIAAAALLRYPEWAALVMITGHAGMTLRTEEQMDAFLRGMRKSFPGAASIHAEDRAGAEYDLVKINGVDALRTSVSMRLPETHPSYATSSVRLFAFASRTGTAVVWFAGPPEHSVALAYASDAIAATVSMPNAGVKSFGRSKYELIGEAIGDLVVALVPAVGIVAYFVHRRRQRQKAA